MKPGFRPAVFSVPLLPFPFNGRKSRLSASWWSCRPLMTIFKALLVRKIRAILNSMYRDATPISNCWNHFGKLCHGIAILREEKDYKFYFYVQCSLQLFIVSSLLTKSNVSIEITIRHQITLC